MNPLTTARLPRSSSGAVLLSFALSAGHFFNKLSFSRNDRLGLLQKVLMIASIKNFGAFSTGTYRKFSCQ